MTHTQVKKQLIEIVPEVAHMLDLLDKDFKSATIILRKNQRIYGVEKYND